MKITKFVFGFPQHVARDNEDGSGGDTTPAAGDGDTTAAQNVSDVNDGTGDPNADKTFSQDDVNKIVVDRNKKLKGQYETLETNYKTILEDRDLSQAARTKIEADLEGVRAQLRTKDQQSKIDKAAAQSQHESELGEANQQALHYKNLFETSTINREIQDAAIKEKAYDAQQFIALVGPHTKMVDELNGNGEKTGHQVPRVEATIVGEDGTPTTVQQTVSEFVLGMKETQPNLFQDLRARGIGTGTDPSAATGELDAANMSMEDYVKNREKIHEQLGYTPRGI